MNLDPRNAASVVNVEDGSKNVMPIIGEFKKQAGENPAFFTPKTKESRRVELRLFSEAELRIVKNDPSQLHLLGKEIDDNYKALKVGSNAPILALASTQPKKRMEVKAASQHTNAKVIDAIDFLSWFLSADEVSHTYLGNAYEKLEHILDRIYNMVGYEKVSATLKENGIDINNVIISVNDCGLAFDQDFSNEPEFQVSRHEHGQTGKFPDVELGPVLDAQGGIREFFNSFWAMAKRKEEAGEEVKLSAKDKALYLFAKLKPDREENEIVSSYAQIPVTISTTPLPDDGIINTERYCIPTNEKMDEEDKGKTIAQMGENFWKKYSAQSMAVKECLSLMGAKKSSQNDFIKVTTDKRKSIYFNSILNFLEGVETNVDGTLLKLHNKIKFMTGKVNANNTESIQDLNKFTRGTILGKLPKIVTDNWDRHFLHIADFFCTKIVDSQLRMETEENKNFIIIEDYEPIISGKKSKKDQEVDFIKQLKDINPATHPYKKLIEMLRYLHEKGFVKQERQYLFDLLDPQSKRLGEHIAKKARENIVAEKLRDTSPLNVRHDTETYGKDCTNKYEVSILGSASTRVEPYLNEAKDLGRWLAAHGMHLRTGGGRYGIMGAVTDGYKEFMQQHPELSIHLHVSAIQMYRTAYFEGVGLSYTECEQSKNKFLMIAKSFDERMTSIFRSDTNIAMAPGIGTYQEIFRFMRLKLAGVLKNNNNLVVYNQEQVNGNEKVRLMDVLLKGVLPASLKKELTVKYDLDGIKAQIIKEFTAKNGHAPMLVIDLQKTRDIVKAMGQRPALG